MLPPRCELIARAIMPSEALCFPLKKNVLEASREPLP
jgi:hypothetical protein